MTARDGYFVSDLHLFARRSQGDAHTRTIHRLARQSHTFVLGGDIFDFQWTTLASVDATIAAATEWLSDLAAVAPQCHVHFLLGNHDHHHEFISALQTLDAAHENLFWHPFYLRLGNSLFLHGDAADVRLAERLALARTRRPTHRKRGITAQWIYDAFVSAGLHRPVPLLVYPKRRTAKRLLAYLDDIGHGPETGIENVYFGHTHRELNAYEYAGVAFHNGGAPMKGVPFRIVPAEVPRRAAA